MPTIREVLAVAAEAPAPPTRIDPGAAIGTVRHQRSRRRLVSGAAAVALVLACGSLIALNAHLRPMPSTGEPVASDADPRFGGPITRDADPMNRYGPPRGTPTISWQHATQLACRTVCGPGTVVYLADYLPYPYTQHRLVYVVREPASPGCLISGPANRPAPPPGWSCSERRETQIDATSGQVQGSSSVGTARLARDLGRATDDVHTGDLRYAPPTGDPRLDATAALTATCSRNQGAGPESPLPFCDDSLGVDVLLADVDVPGHGTQLAYVVTVHSTPCLTTRSISTGTSTGSAQATELCDVYVVVDSSSGSILQTSPTAPA